MIVDWTTLDAPPVRLTLEQSQGGYYTTVDQAGRMFYPPTRNMDAVIRFMRALAIKGDAELDEGSITWFRALANGPTVVSLSEREVSPSSSRVLARANAVVDSRSESDSQGSGGGPVGAHGVSSASAAAEPAPPPVLDLAPVIPIRRRETA